jgi:hypothetical protein
MARSPNQTNNSKKTGATATSPAKAAPAKAPTQDKFGKAFSQGIRNKTSASSPAKTKVTNIEVDYEILVLFGTCLLTFSQHGKSKHAYIYPLLISLGEDAGRVYDTFQVFMQAVLFCNDTPDRKLKKNPSPSTIDVVGLVVMFDQEQDHITEANIGANLLKVVRALVTFANNLARRPSNGEASQTFTYANEFHVGTDYTRPLPRRRHLGQVISPQDSVFYMERIFEGMTFDEIANDPDIMATMYGSVQEGNALVTIARPGFLPQENGNEDHPADDDHHTNPVPFVAEK